MAAKVVVVAEGPFLRGVFSQRQFAFDAIKDKVDCTYAQFCRALREDGNVRWGNGVSAVLTEMNEERNDEVH